MVVSRTGLIGSKVVRNLEARGHYVLAASPQSGVDTAENGGPATVPLSDLVAVVLAADGDPRTVVADPHAR